MNILLVEDEFYTRKALCKMLRNHDPEIEMIFEAENGNEALEILHTNTIDLVFTDVRMPGMDGLDLAKEIQKKNKQIFTVIISGYADFFYAQQAMQYGVKEYVLKPIQKDKILQLYDDFKNKIQSIQKSTMQTRLLQIQQQLNQYISKKSEDIKTSFAQLLALDKEPLHYRLAIIQKSAAWTEQEKEEAQHFFNKQSGKLYFVFSNTAEPTQLLLLCFGSTFITHYEDVEYRNQIYLIKQFIYTIKNISWAVGVSSVHQNISSLSQAYLEANVSVYSYFFEGRDKIFEYDENKSLWNYKLVIEQDLFRFFEHALREGREETAAEVLSKVFTRIKQNSKSFYALQYVCSKLVNLMNEVSKVFQPNSYISIDDPHMKEIVFSQYENIEQIEEQFYRVSRKICTEVKQQQFSQNEIVIEIQKYLVNHYFEDISLEQIASERYYSNPSYLSRIFKLEIGKTFSQALLDIRMDKAKELLQNGDLSVSQVASLVGYNNSAYFVKIFRKYYGIPPGQYKNKIDSQSVYR